MNTISIRRDKYIKWTTTSINHTFVKRLDTINWFLGTMDPWSMPGDEPSLMVSRRWGWRCDYGWSSSALVDASPFPVDRWSLVPELKGMEEACDQSRWNNNRRATSMHLPRRGMLSSWSDFWFRCISSWSLDHWLKVY